MIRNHHLWLMISALTVGSWVAARVDDTGSSGLIRLHQDDDFTLSGEHHFVRDYPARVDADRINVVVEIPAGTNAKWEVDHDDGRIHWEMRHGKPRVVQYLPYVANYGMVPRTLLDEDSGGDGDPLDVLLLGPARSRGDVVSARLIGVLEMLDDGEQDDKLIAVSADSPFAAVHSIKELNEKMPGVTTIVRTWFDHYKGPGRIQTRGFKERASATRILDDAAAAYERDAND